MIQLQQIRLQRGNNVLLDQADLTIHKAEKVGVVGANGAGKTTFFLLLQKQLQADYGEVLFPKRLKMQWLSQETPDTEETALNYTCYGDAIYHELCQQLSAAELAGEGMLIADIHEKMANHDAYRIPAKAAKILLGLGFTQGELYHSVNAFSGGWRMRINLARLLISNADVYLLDEPTNHLDLEAIIWLENWLKQVNQTLIIISHDRAFLDKICNRIVHLEQQKLMKYTGDYSTFEKSRAEKLAIQQATYQKQQQVKAHLTSFVERFRYKASKAKQAQSRLKQLEKMQWVASVHVSNPFLFNFKPAPSTGDPMIQLSKVSVGYGETTILKNIEATIRRQDRIALVGPNGAGKSTFVKYLAGELSAKTGDAIQDKKIKVGYFAQHQLEQLTMDESPLWHFEQMAPNVSTTEARKYLGGFNFSQEDVFRPVDSFSGGEKSRLALALLIWQAPNILLLDEPTNHLDMEMREALNLALQSYEGAMILISHDRYLLESVADQIWLVAHDTVQPFESDLDAFQDWLFEYRAQQVKIGMQQSFSELGEEKAQYQSKKSDLKRIQQLEKQLKNHELALTKLDNTLETLASQSPYDETAFSQLSMERQHVMASITETEEALLEYYGSD